MCWCVVIFDFFLAFLIFLQENSDICEDQAAMHIAKPFFPKRAFSFIYLAKTEGLWSRKVKTLSGTKAPPFYWEIWAQKPFCRKKGFAICIGFQSFLLRGKWWILENCKVFLFSADFFFKNPAKKNSRGKNTPRKKSNSSSSCSNFIFWTKFKNSPKIWKIRNFCDVLISAKIEFAKKKLRKISRKFW